MQDLEGQKGNYLEPLFQGFSIGDQNVRIPAEPDIDLTEPFQQFPDDSSKYIFCGKEEKLKVLLKTYRDSNFIEDQEFDSELEWAEINQQYVTCMENDEI